MSDHAPATEATVPPFEAVIFDLDGVLVDSEPVHHRAARGLALPGTISDREYRRFMGMPVEPFLAWLIDRDALAHTVEDLLGRYTALIVAELEREPPPPLPGTRDWIAGARSRALAIGLCSQSRAAWVEPTLAASGLAGQFDHVVTGEAASRAKPHPDLYLQAARGLGVDPAACLVVEDSIPGVRAARAAGMTVVQTRAGTGAPPPQPEARWVVDSLVALDLAFVLGSGPGTT